MALGIGDDAALLDSTPGQQLVMASDTLVEGVHFPVSASAGQIGTRALCVNLSDMAAMGATPRWFTLALTLPKEKANDQWLAKFSGAIAGIANRYNIALVGGDTTSGPLSVSMTLLGEVPAGDALQRSGAQVGDRVFVTGTLGDGVAGLKLAINENSAINVSERLLKRFYSPYPQIETGLRLRRIATACIDISDGLVADLGHICQSSGVSATISTEQLPIAEDVRQMAGDQAVSWVLNGGDDYQLCFTVSADKLEALEQLIEESDLDVTAIGTIDTADKANSVDKAKPVTVLDRNGEPVEIHKQGYKHFGQ